MISYQAWKTTLVTLPGLPIATCCTCAPACPLPEMPPTIAPSLGKFCLASTLSPLHLLPLASRSPPLALHFSPHTSCLTSPPLASLSPLHFASLPLRLSPVCLPDPHLSAANLSSSWIWMAQCPRPQLALVSKLSHWSLHRNVHCSLRDASVRTFCIPVEMLDDLEAHQ